MACRSGPDCPCDGYEHRPCDTVTMVSFAWDVIDNVGTYKFEKHSNVFHTCMELGKWDGHLMISAHLSTE